MATRRDPSKRAGVWSLDTMYPEEKKYTLEELMAITNSPARAGLPVNADVSVLDAAKGILKAADWETFKKGMPWAPAEGDGPSNAQAALIGIGRFLDKTRAGTADLLDRASINVSRGKYVDQALERRRRRREDQAAKDKEYSKLEETHPLATTLGEMTVPMASLPAGLITQGVSKVAPKAWGAAQATNAGKLLGMSRAAKNIPTPMGWKRAIGTEAALGGASGASHYDASALEGMLWGAAGGAGGKYISDLLGGTATNLRGNAPQIVKNAKKHGLFVTPGMATGHRATQQMDKAVSTHRASKEIYDDLLTNSKIKEHRLISKELGGEATDFFDKDFMNKTESRITDKMTDLTEGVTGYFDNSLAGRTQRILEEFDDVNMDADIPDKLKMHAQKIIDAVENGTPLSGEEYQKATQTLNRLASKQFNLNGDSDLGKAFKGLSEVYNDAISNGMEGTGEAFKKARKEFALFKSIEKNLEHNRHKGFSGVEGFLDTAKLADDFKSSSLVKELGDIEKYRKSMPGASLGTSSLFGKMMKGVVRDPNEMLGAGALLTGRALSPIGMFDEMLVGGYLKGYPHVTGILPGFKRVKDKAATIPARMLKGKESMFEKEEIVDPREEEGTEDDGGWQTLEQTGGGGYNRIEFADDVDWEDLKDNPLDDSSIEWE